MTVCYYKFHFASFHSSKYNKTLVSRGQFIDDVIRNLKLRPGREEDYLPSLLSLSSAMERFTHLGKGDVRLVAFADDEHVIEPGGQCVAVGVLNVDDAQVSRVESNKRKERFS